MINVTESFIQLLNANSRTFRMKLVNGSDEYTNILNLKWFAALPSYLSIGNALCTCVECKAVGIPISIKGTYLDVYITIIGSDEWVQIGSFKAEKPTLQNGVVSFSAYDIMNECSKAIFAHKLGTVTISECYETVIADIESEIGTVSYVPLSDDVASLTVNADMLCGYDCRNVLAYIAGYLGCNCVINNTGAIEMRGFTVCAYTLDDNRIAEPELDDDISDLEFLACSVNSDTKLLYGNNGEGFEFICPIMTQERLNQIGATLCASTSAVNVYRSGKIKHILGDLRLQIGDVVSLEHNDETHIIPISSIVFEFDGGLSADIEALPLAEASFLSLAETLDFVSKQNANKRIKGITNYYLATSETEGVTKDRTDWTYTIQNVTADKKYLWNYEVITLADGTTYETEPCIIGNFAENGSNGRGIKSITEYYLTTQTESTPAKSNFKDTVQTPTESLPCLWNYEKIEYDDGSKPYESEVRIIGVYGTKGSDGKTYYTWIKYADDASGTNMSDDPSGKKYMGIAINKTTDTESPTASDYTWSLIKGTDGKGVSKVEIWYYLSTSETSLVGGSWSTSAPTWTDGTYLWTKLVTTYNDGDTEESAPVVDASWKKTSAVEKASGEINEALANALGLYTTDLTVSGSKIRYYHTNPTLSASVEGDTILVFNASGFGVCTSGWNSGNPQFTYGTTFDGKAVWNILVANKIKADFIETGQISSVDGAKVKTTLDLDSGEMAFESSNAILKIKGDDDDADVEKVISSAGIQFTNKTTGVVIYHTLDGMRFFTSESLAEFEKWVWSEVVVAILNGRDIDFSTEPNFHLSRVQLDKIQTKKLYCEDICIFSDETGNDSENLIDALTEMNSQISSMKESLTILQEKYKTLEETIGQAHEHTAKTSVKENIVEATCETAGSYDSVVYCATCGEEVSRETITVDALGHTDSNGDGYCDTCGVIITDVMIAKISSSGAGSGDTVYISSTVNGGTNLGTSEPFTKNQTFYYYAKAGTGRVITKVVVGSTSYTVEQLVEIGLSEDHTTLNLQFAAFEQYLGSTLTATVYFADVESGDTTYYTITTDVSPSGAGTVSGGGRYAEDVSVSLTATPVSGYVLSDWKITNDNTGESFNWGSAENPLTFSAMANTTVTAVFTSDESSGSSEIAIFKVSASGKTSDDSINIIGPDGYSVGTQIELADGESCTIYADTISGRQITQVELIVDGTSQFTVSASDLYSADWLTSDYRVLTIPVSFATDSIGTTSEYKVYFGTA